MSFFSKFFGGGQREAAPSMPEEATEAKTAEEQSAENEAEVSQENIQAEEETTTDEQEQAE